MLFFFEKQQLRTWNGLNVWNKSITWGGQWLEKALGTLVGSRRFGTSLMNLELSAQR